MSKPTVGMDDDYIETGTRRSFRNPVVRGRAECKEQTVVRECLSCGIQVSDDSASESALFVDC